MPKATIVKDVTSASDRCYAEIDLGRIEKNFRIYKNSLPPDFRIIAVVKADGYGHGAAQTAMALHSVGARDFAVATADEGIALRKAGISGLGGATFPTYAKIQSAIGKADKIIINCAECEPFICANLAAISCTTA